MSPATAWAVSGMSRNPDEAEPAHGAAASAPVSFEAHMLALLPSLRRYSRSLTRSDSEGEDLLQDCVEKALSSRAQWRGVNFKSWLYRIMTNLHLNRRRTLRRHPSVSIEEAEAMTAGGPGDPLEMKRLSLALEALPADARAVLMLVAVEGYGYREVAEMLEIPIGTVMSRLSRARQMLREQLAEENVIHLRRPR